MSYGEPVCNPDNLSEGNEHSRELMTVFRWKSADFMLIDYPYQRAEDAVMLIQLMMHQQSCLEEASQHTYPNP